MYLNSIEASHIFDIWPKWKGSKKNAFGDLIPLKFHWKKSLLKTFDYLHHPHQSLSLLLRYKFSRAVPRRTFFFTPLTYVHANVCEEIIADSFNYFWSFLRSFIHFKPHGLCKSSSLFWWRQGLLNIGGHFHWGTSFVHNAQYFGIIVPWFSFRPVNAAWRRSLQEKKVKDQ